MNIANEIEGANVLSRTNNLRISSLTLRFGTQGNIILP